MPSLGEGRTRVRVWRSLNYMMADPEGLKRHLVGALLLFVPVLGWVPAAGYPLRVMCRVANGNESLPPWERFGDLAVKGFVFWLAWFTYNLPLALLNRMEDGAGLTSPALLWSVLVYLFLPAGLILYLETGSLISLYRFDKHLEFIRRTFRDYLAAWLVTMFAWTFGGLGMAAALNITRTGGTLLGLAAFLLAAFTLYWAVLTTAHLFGRVAQRSAARLPHLD